MFRFFLKFHVVPLHRLKQLELFDDTSNLVVLQRTICNSLAQNGLGWKEL